MGAYDRPSMLQPHETDRSQDIPLINVGVAVLPDPAAPVNPILVRGSRPAKRMTTRDVHNTFNHMDSTRLGNLPRCSSDAPAEWASVDKQPCDDCERANQKRIHPEGHLDPDDVGTYSTDMWSVSVGHIHGGQKQVHGFHHNSSGLTRLYLQHTKTGAESARATRLWLSWAQMCGVTFRRQHADKAPLT